MIAYLPEIYPDELVYSWFCRYYVHTGCLTHKTALQEILYARCNNPSKEFLGHLNPNMIVAIQRMYPISDVILCHTMYPQYARFIPLTEKKKALYHIGYNFCDVHHLFAVLPRNETDLYLRYCPVCVNEDRKNYGETYWHRIHQIRNINICSKHKCKLVNSTVTAKSEKTFTLCSAESHTINQEPTMETNTLKIAYAKYITDVFNANIDFKNDTPISAILYNALNDTPYMKNSGKTKYTKQLTDDINTYYHKIGIWNVASMSQIQRLFLGERFDFSVVCQVAFFLGMSVDELISSELTQNQIEQEQNSHYMKDKTPIDWKALDEETAPLLEQIASNIYYGITSEIGRPERVSEKQIYRELELPGHRLENLPKCKAIFDRYTESYEENWARRIVWAYNKLQKERNGTPFYWSDIRKISGVKKKNIDAVIPFIRKHANSNTSDKIIQICTNKNTAAHYG